MTGKAVGADHGHLNWNNSRSGFSSGNRERQMIAALKRAFVAGDALHVA
tara:strand:- start:206 stop:352 length:147 start_codon:yes stop_codon:yes gene_type:complete